MDVITGVFLTRFAYRRARVWAGVIGIHRQNGGAAAGRSWTSDFIARSPTETPRGRSPVVRGGNRALTVPDYDWGRVESLYGVPLPPQIRPS